MFYTITSLDFISIKLYIVQCTKTNYIDDKGWSQNELYGSTVKISDVIHVSYNSGLSTLDYSNDGKIWLCIKLVLVFFYSSRCLHQN